MASDRVGGRTGDLDADGIPTHKVANLLGVFFVHPGLEFTPPEGRTGRGRSGAGRREGVRLRGRQLDRQRARRLLWMRPLVEEGVAGVAVGERRSGREEWGGVEVWEAAGRRGAMVLVKN